MVSRCLLMTQRCDNQCISPATANSQQNQPISPVVDTHTPSESSNNGNSTKPNSGIFKSSLGSDQYRQQPSMDPCKKIENMTPCSGSAYKPTGVSNRAGVMDIRRPSVPEHRDSPDEYLWRRLESLVECMFSENQGIPIRNVKSLMSTIPSVFSGSDIVLWFLYHVGADDVTEAVHLATRISAMGYLFSIDDHTLTVKNDSHTYYRFQTPCLYPSRCPEADTVDYAVYLCKRTMQNKHRLELTDFEAERLASLQSLYYHKWEFIYMQAEAEMKVDKKRDKFERIVLESQEAAFWDVHRPAPGCVNTTEVDMRKLCRAKRPKKIPIRPTGFPIPSGPVGILFFSVLDGLSADEKLIKLKASMHKRIKVSKAIENLQNYCDQYAEFDLMLCTAAASGPAYTPATAGQGSSSQGASVSLGGAGGGAGSISGGTGLATTLSGVSLSSSAVFPLASRKTSTVVGSQHPTTMTLGMVGGTHPSTPSSDKVNDNSNSLDTAAQCNPWISDSADYWNSMTNLQDLSIRRVKRWSFSFQELLKDPLGRGKFQRWLEKEFSAENLMFWEECQNLKSAPLRELPRRIQFIYSQYLSLSAAEPVNVDSKVREIVFRHLGLTDETSESSGRKGATVGAGAGHLDRYCFEEAEDQIFHLMKSDSYCRFLRSDVYRELFANTKKKSKKHRGGVLLVGGVVNFGSAGGNITND